LDELTPVIKGSVDDRSEVDTRVTVEEGAQIVNSVIRGPAIIGRNTRIVNSYVGPFSSIYHNVVIENSEIERSIVLEHSSIRDIPSRIQDSLIGRFAEVTINTLRPQAIKMNLGDHSRLGLL
jgi:glucose-1-phosphate thymidylyltransferase